MGMKGNNLLQQCYFGPAVVPQSISNTTINGATISAPWEKGRQIAFFFAGGAFASGGNLTIKVQGQKRSDDTWVTLKDAKGVNDLQVDPTAIDDAGVLENGVIAGSIDMADIDGVTYKALRLTVQEGATAACLVCIMYVIFDTYVTPIANVDYLFDRARYGT